MPIPDEYKGLATLPNGLKIAVLSFDKKTLVNVYLYVRSFGDFVPLGGEPPGPEFPVVEAELEGQPVKLALKPGVNHYTEHMLYRGLKKKKFNTARQIMTFLRPLNRDDLDSISGETRETTLLYSIEVSKDKLEAAIEFLAELTLRPLISDPSGETREKMERAWELERRVVLEEMAYSDDDTENVANERVRHMMFPRHPLGLSIEGLEKNINSITLFDLANCHRLTYHPSNMVLVVSGGGSSLIGVKKLAQKYFRSRKRKPLEIVFPPPAIRKHVSINNRVEFIPAPRRKTYVAIGFPFSRPVNQKLELMPYWVSKKYGVWVLKKVVGGRWGSRPVMDIREKYGLGYRHLSFLEEFRGVGILFYTAHLLPDGVEKTARLMTKIFGELVSAPLPKDELEDAKESWCAELDAGAEIPSSLADHIFTGLYFEDRVPAINEVKKKIRAVTAEDVLRVAKEILKPGRLYAVFAGNVPDEKGRQELIDILNNW